MYKKTAKKRKRENKSTEFTQFLESAELKKLNSKEAEIIYRYSKLCNFPPLHALKNKKTFEKVISKYVHNEYGYSDAMVEDIRKKLGFEPEHFIELSITHDIGIGRKGKIKIDEELIFTISLFKKDEKFMLWKIDKFLNTKKIKDKMPVTIYLEPEKGKGVYKFDSVIEQVIRAEHCYLKIPQSLELEKIKRRRDKRIDTDIEAVVQNIEKIPHSKPLYKYRICNISKGGIQLCIHKKGPKDFVFSIGEKILIKFSLNNISVEVEGEEVYRISNKSLGVKFTKMDEESRVAIEKFLLQKGIK
ncbi:PilZ domain-containing protein [Nitrosophilus alvini]|uniref:PilZ domain-containing protein n=1 Tax=Nitrosophilus alvini TaxID=2714855 RepID=UPI00190960AE|nr:PilZ domain-containing protein [Nitrosophilus alvini]